MGHVTWTNMVCFMVNAGFIITAIYSLIFLFSIPVTSELMVSIAVFVMIIDSLFLWYYTKSRWQVLLELKDKEIKLKRWMHVVHFLSIFLSYVLPNLLYTLCLGEEFIW